MPALYRKYRPQSFEEIVGQQHVVKTLQNEIAAGNVSHAYLFCGPRGSGKTSIARLFAKALNCEKPKNGEPCNECGSCLEITQGNSIDLIEIDAASHRGIDDIRELKEGIKFAPVKSKYKIFIIDECHQLSKDAANALLKTLEEPPSHAIFILATTESNKMIPTIVSRCQRFDFKKLQVSEIVEKLQFICKKEKVKAEEAALSLIALNARGSFRDAESLLDKCFNFTGEKAELTVESVKSLLGIVETGEVAKLVGMILKKETKEAVLFINSLNEQSVDLPEFAKTLVYYMHQMLLLKMDASQKNAKASGFSAEELKTLLDQIAATPASEISNALELFVDAENKMKFANIPQLPLELAIIKSIGL
jgi:DNA polymerase-3 subunit gamma/tau